MIEATTTAGTRKTLPVSPFGSPLYKVEVCFLIYDYEIISERKCKIHVPLLFLELMTSFKEMPTDSFREHLFFIEVDDL